MKPTNAKVAPAKPVSRKPYSPPVLKVYGTLAKLTASGSSGAPEGSSSSPSKQKP